MKPSVVGPDSENTGRLHPNSPPQWMGQECSGPFTSLAVLDDHALLVVGRQKDKSSSTEVLILLQRVPSGWRCWPLLAEGVEKGGVVRFGVGVSDRSPAWRHCSAFMLDMGLVLQQAGLARSTMEIVVGSLSPTRRDQGRTHGCAHRRFLDSD